uniref:BACK domain-containing protein n=1 Tax=Strigamia maritima TaxID=126957 RepID=T1JEF1_STRMM
MRYYTVMTIDQSNNPDNNQHDISSNTTKDCKSKSNVDASNEIKNQRFHAGGKEEHCTDATIHNPSSEYVANTLMESPVIILIGKKRFSIERKILELYSIYFKTHPDINKNIPIILDSKLNPKAWQLVHTWLTSQNGITLDAKHVVNIYITAKHLQIPKLVNQCLQFIVNYIGDISNDVMMLMQEIMSVCDEELSQLAHQTLVNQGQHLLRSGQFLNYNVVQVSDLLRDDMLSIKSEKSLFDAAMLWLLHKWPERCVNVTQVVGCVRFGLMTESELIACYLSESAKYFLDIPQCQEMILKAFQYLSAVDVGYEMLVRNLAPKQRKGVQPSSSDMNSISGVTSVRSTSECWSLSEFKDADNQLQLKAKSNNSTCCSSRDSSAKDEKCHFQSSKSHIKEANEAAAKIQAFFRRYKIRKAQSINPTGRNELRNNKYSDNLFFGICGPSILMFAHDSNIDKDVVLCYDIGKDKWQQILLINHQLKNYAAAKLGNKIFITGGIMRTRFNRPIIVNSAKFLDLNNAQWRNVNHLQIPRFDHSLVACNDKLFAIGGFGHRELSVVCLSSIECYYPTEDRWTEITSLPKARAGAVVLNCGRHLWVCGGVVYDKHKVTEGFVATDQVDCYDVLRNYWYAQCPLPLSLGYSLGLIFHGNIYLIGGASTFLNVPQYSNSGLSNRMFMFDIVKENWSELERSIRPRFKAAGVVVGNYFYVFGGCHSPHSAECFSWKRKKWFKISKSPHPVVGSACFFIWPY